MSTATVPAVWDEGARAALVDQARRVLRGPDPDDRAASAPASTRAVNASMSLPALLEALSRIGWGPLRGREWAASRAILEALSLASQRERTSVSATVAITARQLAKRAAYSLRHTSRCLHWMEDAGLIAWRRGGIERSAGTNVPTVGVIKVIKRKLVDWIRAFRRASDAEDRKRNAETRRRLQHYRLWRNNQRPRSMVSVDVDMSSPLPSLTGEGASAAAPHHPRPGTKENGGRPRRREKDRLRKESTMRTQQSLPEPEFMPLVCGHGADAPRWCNACRSEGWQHQQDAARALERVERERAAEAARKKEEIAQLPTAFELYMRDTYPDATPRQWGRLALGDPEAKRLARESVR